MEQNAYPPQNPQPTSHPAYPLPAPAPGVTSVFPGGSGPIQPQAAQYSAALPVNGQPLPTVAQQPQQGYSAAGQPVAPQSVANLAYMPPRDLRLGQNPLDTYHQGQIQQPSAYEPGGIAGQDQYPPNPPAPAAYNGYTPAEGQFPSQSAQQYSQPALAQQFSAPSGLAYQQPLDTTANSVPIPPVYPQPPLQSIPPTQMISGPVQYHMGPEKIIDRLKVVAAVLVVISILVGAGIFAAGQLTGAANYASSRTVTVDTGSGALDGTYSVVVPTDFTEQERQQDWITLVHKQGDATEPSAQISVNPIYVGEQTIGDVKPTLLEQTRAQSGGIYEGFVVENIKAATNNLAGELTIEPFTESTNGAGLDTMTGDFKLVAENGSKWAGRFTMVFGSENLYVLSVIATDKLWLQHTGVWSEVFSSFTVDIPKANNS